MYLVSAVGCAFFFLVLVLLWPGGGMGLGDAKMGLFMGALLGPRVLVAVFVAFLLGSIVGIYLMVVKKATRKTKVPFGPFLAIGGVLALYRRPDCSSTHTRAFTAKRVMMADLELERNRPLRATVEREGGRYSFCRGVM